MTMRPLLTALSAALLAAGLLTTPGVAAAASHSAEASVPVDGVTQLQVRTTANCVAAEGRCHFSSGANLLGPDGPIGFPPDFWARQTLTVRSNDRDVWQEAQYSAPSGTPRERKGANHDNALSKSLKSLNTYEVAVTYFGGGPIERFSIDGDSVPTDWATGQPNTTADFIVCSEIHVVYGGHNLRSPTACSQTRF